MSQILRDLLQHQAWADAEHWRAFDAHPAALEDAALRERQHHIHLVQSGFLWVVSDRSRAFQITTPQDYARPQALRQFALDCHRGFVEVLDALDEAGRTRVVNVPWFEDPPLDLSVEQALTQCAMHSQHHRGQNATRLRELGGQPPMTDLIVWYWKGRPGPRWS
jgi:uncharacterized damage-inducible protein DinB